MAKVVTCGELMIRSQPYDHERFVQADQLESTFGGGDSFGSGLIYSLLNGYSTQDVSRSRSVREIYDISLW